MTGKYLHEVLHIDTSKKKIKVILISDNVDNDYCDNSLSKLVIYTYLTRNGDWKDMDHSHSDSAADAARAITTLTLDQLTILENELDVYEKVSLMYLLCDEPHLALEQLLALLEDGTVQIIYNWAESQHVRGSEWEEKLVEALCIIQNYKALKRLGFNREDPSVRFFPFPYVNKTRKALYLVCEEFEQSDIQCFLDLVCPDLLEKGLDFKVFDLEYLELYFLYWESIGFIKQNNLHKICSVLKQMNQSLLANRLTELSSDKMPSSCSSSTLNSVDNADLSLATRYDIDPNNPGVCLIINQEYFYREIDPDLEHLLPPPEQVLEPRTGTDHDKMKLIATFEQLGFKIKTSDNLTHSEIIEIVKEVAEGVTNECSIFVCILSHGDEGVVYGVNSCRVKVSEIKKNICSPTLVGKPKVLILQICQGIVCHRVSEPLYADLFTFWSTIPGYTSLRDKKSGTWFIQSLCDKMLSLGDRFSFNDLCSKVTGHVCDKKWSQVPMVDHTLRHSLYLPSKSSS